MLSMRVHTISQKCLYSLSTADANYGSLFLLFSPTGSRPHRTSAVTRIMDLICISLKDTEAVLLAAPIPRLPTRSHVGRQTELEMSGRRGFDLCRPRLSRHTQPGVSQQRWGHTEGQRHPCGALSSGLRSTYPDRSTCERNLP